MAVSAAARGFALALVVRRLLACAGTRRDAPVLWCASTGNAGELGTPYGPGCNALGLDPRRLIIVEPARSADVLWALEEGLKSNGLALVLGQLDEVGLTPARRLALAAARSETPCLILTHPRAAVTPATSTRWRIAPAPSTHHRLDAEAPGATRYQVALERCRNRSTAAQSVSLMLEWCDAAYCFRLAAGVADRAFAPGQPDRWPGRAVGIGR